MRYGALLIGLLIAFPASAAPTTMRLVCTVTRAITSRGEESSSGEYLITVSYSVDGVAVIKKSDLGVDFFGTVTEEEIHGDAKYKMGDSDVEQTITINRYTGTYENYLSYGIGSALVFYGRCRPAEKPLF